MRIDHDGKVGIGDSTPDVELDVVGDINDTGTITDVSDKRLKDNIGPLQDAPNKVPQISGVHFNMKDAPDQREVGLIAQDVQKILPEVVRMIDSETGYLGVSHPMLIPLLVEAVKEIDAVSNARSSLQKEEINELRSRIATLVCLIPATIVRRSQMPCNPIRTTTPWATHAITA